MFTKFDATPIHAKGRHQRRPSVIFLLGSPLQVEADAHAVVVLGKFCDGRSGGIATHRPKGLQDVEHFLRLKKQADAIGCHLDVTIHAKQEGLEGDGTRIGIVGVGAAKRLASHLGRERLVLFEGEGSVAAVHA